MRVYTYTASDLGIAEIPSGTLRFDGAEPVAGPAEADVIIVPSIMYFLRNEKIDIRKLKFMGQWPEKHVLWDCADNFETFPDMQKPLFIRCCLTKRMLEANPRSVCCAWPVKDFADCVDVPEWGFRYDVSFHGWASSPVRVAAAESIKEEFGDSADVKLYPDFYGYVERDDPAEAARRWSEFKRSMRESRLALCPASITASPPDGRGGVFPYRFFEALSAGRVPVLFCDEFVWPFAPGVNWDEFCFVYPESQAKIAGELCRNILCLFGDKDLLEMGRRGREVWLRWLDSREWPRIHGEIVREKWRS